MDPIEHINFDKDTSLAMLWAANKLGWNITYITDAGLYISNGEPRATCCELKVFHAPNNWFEKGPQKDIGLSELDVILMRKDPPFDNEFIYKTYILELAEKLGTLIVNKPSSLRDFNEKIFATHFPQCCPPHLVTKNPEQLRAFHKEHKDVIFKPLDGMGGSRIFRLKEQDPNMSVIIETLTSHGQETIMAQKFIPEIKAGDKRILIVDGKPIPYALARIPAKGETRGNLAAGATSQTVALSDRDQWICDQIIPTLKDKELLFVGLDVIGDYLTEINITSPTCVREIDKAHNLNIADLFMSAIENKLR